MALLVEPIATEQLAEMRNALGPRYINAIWAQRSFEQEAQNEEATARWRASYPAWDRLFGRHDPSVNTPNTNVVSIVSEGPENNKAA